MKKYGNKTAILLLYGLICGCVHGISHEPFPWDDDAPIVKARRVDILEAEAAVIRFLRARGAFSALMDSCTSSTRAYEIFTSETDDAYQVFVRHNPNLCDSPPHEEVHPPTKLGPDGGPAEYAVSKKDLHIISVRFRGDKPKAARGEAVDANESQDAPPDAGAPEAADAGVPPTDSLPLTSSPDAGFPIDGELLPRWQLPDTYTTRMRRLGQALPDGGLPEAEEPSPSR